MKVTLFVTCLVDMFETNVGKATVEVLERLGCEIEFRSTSLLWATYNSDHVEATKEAMKHMIETLKMQNILLRHPVLVRQCFMSIRMFSKMIQSGLNVHKSC